MTSENQDFEEDELLAAFDTDQEYDYEGELGTQIPVGTGEVEEFGSMATSVDGADQNVPEKSMMEGSPKITSKKMISCQAGNGDVVGVENNNPVTANLQTPNNIEEGNIASRDIPTDVIKLEDDVSNVVNLWPSMENNVIDITDSGDEEDVINVDKEVKVHVKTEPLDIPFRWTDMSKEVIDLSGSDAESGEETILKTEQADASFPWTPMTSDPIEIADESSDDVVMSTSPTHQASEPTRGFNLGKSVFQNRPAGPEMNVSGLLETQRRYAEKALNKAEVTGAGSIFKAPHRRSISHLGDASDAEEDSEDSDDEDANFQERARLYRAKVKAGTNTDEDDIAFITAREKEEAIIKRAVSDRLHLDAALAMGEDVPAEEMDKSLFVAQFPSSRNATKRRLNVSLETDDEATVSGDPNQTKSLRTKRAKITKSKKRRNTKGLKAQEEMAKEAGMEEFLEYENGEPDENTETQKKGKSTRNAKSKRAKPGVSRTKTLKSGTLTNISNLVSGSVYESAAANANRPALATDNSTTKNMALKAMLAGIPLENQRQGKADRQIILRATTLLGFRKVHRDGQGGWTLKGMTTHLHNHQVVASGVMRERETGTRKPLGGLLADAMGLGKTVEVIATMVANPPAEGEETRCTLIVAPPSLVNQWMSELNKHCEPRFFKRIFRYDATSKMKGEGVEYIMQEADVIFTTYQEVMSSYPKCDIPKDTDGDEKKQLWAENWEKHRGVLHRVHFHRVVLDEAHAIKNHKSQTSIACRGLMAKHRWAVTGTPVHNSVEEFFSYFKFLQVKETGTFKIFKANFCKADDPICTRRLHAMLNQWMIRRTHADTLMGAPIIKLPELHEHTESVTFNVVERQIYDIVRLRYTRAINVLSKNGELEAAANLVLTSLIRLRQLTAHPFLVQSVLEKFFDTKTIEELRKISTGNRHESEMIATLHNFIKAKALSAAAPSGAVDDAEDVEVSEDNSYIASGESIVDRYRKFLNTLRAQQKWEDLKDRSFCQKCGNPPEEPYITSCFHVYCKECLVALADDAAKRGASAAECIPCGRTYGSSEAADDIRELDMDVTSVTSNQERRPKPRKRNIEDELKWIDVGGKLLSSSKTRAVQAQLQAWMRQEPDKKIIVFSQFHMLLQMVGRMCEENKWGCCHYNGKMSTEARDKAVKTFGEKPETKIMIASLKCGGVGLNLTMASKVICIDLWWNSCVEQQAFCRVFRLGQMSETFITRFYVKDTIDELLLKTQKKKGKAIAAALDPKSRKLADFTLKELMELFGPVEEDENGRAFILVDDEKNPQSDGSDERDELTKRFRW